MSFNENCGKILMYHEATQNDIIIFSLKLNLNNTLDQQRLKHITTNVNLFRQVLESLSF